MSTQQTTLDALNLEEQNRTENTNEPERIAYNDIETPEDLIEYSQQYAAEATTQYDIDVNLALIVEWDVSKRAKRRAAAVKTTSIQKSTRGQIRTRIGMPLNWDTARDLLNDVLAQSSKHSRTDIRECGMSLTWRAFQEFTKEEWHSTIRHELIHVEQYQKYGDSDHGTQFKRRARELDTECHCRSFYTGKYLLVCAECRDVKADRTRRSKYVKMADPDNSEFANTLKTTKCCDSKLTLEMND